MTDRGVPLPKFGEWDVNNPASADGFTVIFKKARDEKKTSANPGGSESPGKGNGYKPQETFPTKTGARKWFCCV